MNSLIKRFYNINRVNLSIIGLWPYQDEKTRLIRAILVNAAILFISTSHIAKLVTTDFDLDSFLEILPFTLSVLMIIASYYCLLGKLREMRTIWDYIQRDWNEPMNTQEINILEQYALTSKLYNTVLVVACHAIPVFVMLQMIAPVALDIILPLNESRPLVPPLGTETFIDHEKYFLFTLTFVTSVSVCLGIVATAIFGSLMIQILHACGMFRLVWYTLDKAFEKTNRILYTIEENERVYNNIVRSIKFHNRAIEYMEVVNIFFERLSLVQITFFFLFTANNIFRVSFVSGMAFDHRLLSLYSFIFTVLGQNFQITFHVCQLLRIKTFKKEASRAILCLLQTIISFIISFVSFHISQNVINHSTDVFDQAYVTSWYMVYPKSQRLLLMLMMNSLKPSHISVGNMFVLSNELYATIMQTTLSYAMIIHSLQ